MRMLRMENIQRGILDEIERTLRSEFMSNLARSHRGDAHELVAEIFNNFDRGMETRFMTALEERNQETSPTVSVTYVSLYPFRFI